MEHHRRRAHRARHGARRLHAPPTRRGRASRHLSQPPHDAASTRHKPTVEGFGREWAAFDQTDADPAELARIFDAYFSVFPWAALPADARGIDVGCGSGRWAALAAERAGSLVAVDPSADALGVASRRLASCTNVSVVQGAAGELPFADGTFDFGYSLGVLHHTTDPPRALASCVRTLKRGAPFLVYLYYAFDNRPPWFRALWRVSNALRRGVSRLPFRMKLAVTGVTAVGVYWPLARAAGVGARRGRDVDDWPLSYYRDKSLYVMRNDALDRFGTRLEHRFTRAQVVAMLEAAGLRGVTVSDGPPYWCAVGYRA